jgi:hypothetical protein
MKLKSVLWHSVPRQSRLAAVMYPNLTSAENQRDMAAFARNEGKKSPMQGKIDAEQAQRAKQQTKPSGRR